MRGLGFKSQRDALQRFFLFRKGCRGRYPLKHEILDQLICLSLVYGDTTKMAHDQTITLSNIILPEVYYKKHDHPYTDEVHIIP